MTERAALWLVLEQGSGHLNDHVLASCAKSMIIVTCADDQRRCPQAARTAGTVSLVTGPRSLVSWSMTPNAATMRSAVPVTVVAWGRGVRAAGGDRRAAGGHRASPRSRGGSW